LTIKSDLGGRMEYYRLTIPIPKQPWRWIHFRISTILLLTTIAAVALAWRRDHRRMAAERHRLQYPYPHYQAEQALGPPDAPNLGDSSSAWCPATDGGKEWLLLEYQKAVLPTAIIVHENSSSGAVVKVTDYRGWGRETPLWEGAYPPAPGASGGVARLPVAGSVRTNRIKVYLDTGAAAGWNEIDAVGIEYGVNKVMWARDVQASSTWGQ
jgi:hypothetical protein